MRNSRKIFAVVFITLLSLIRMALVYDKALFVIGNSPHDDYLFVSAADALLDGRWFGEYNEITIARGPVYPLFLAGVHIIGGNVLFWQHMLYLISAGLLVYSLKRRIGNIWASVALYGLLIFAPFMFDSDFYRVIRYGIYPSLIIGTIAAAIGAWEHRMRLRAFSIWMILYGTYGTLFWYCREEGLFLVLPLFSLEFARMIYILRHKRFSMLAPTALAYGIFIVFTLTIALLNRAYYGVFTVRELKERSFVRAYQQITRVRSDVWHPLIPVPKAARETLYEHSPSFRRLQNLLELKGGWAYVSSNNVPMNPKDGEIAGGWFYWAFRQAVFTQADQKDGMGVKRYYDTLASEIDALCASRVIECAPPSIGLLPQWNSGYVPLLLDNTLEGVKYFISPWEYIFTDKLSWGSDDQIDLFEFVTRNQAHRTEGAVVLANQANALNIATFWLIGTMYSIFVIIGLMFGIISCMVKGIDGNRTKWSKVYIDMVLLISVLSHLVIAIAYSTTSDPIVRTSMMYIISTYPLFLALLFIQASDVIAWMHGRVRYFGAKQG